MNDSSNRSIAVVVALVVHSMTEVASIRRRLLGISPHETEFARRGFTPSEPAVQRHLETAGKSFVNGYNAALEQPRANDLAANLNQTDPMFRGFAFEGAAMGLALLDLVTPWNRRRFESFRDSPAGDAHWYMIHVGAGWAMARIPWARRRFERTFAHFDRLYRWLALDGYGFHEGFFHAKKYLEAQARPTGLSGQAAQVFDQGLGRSMWFSHGADPARIAARIATFPLARPADLWSGVGLAASYAGGVDRDRLEDLRGRAEGFEPHLAQGAVFAAKARQRAGNLVPHTELACEVFCGLPADAAARLSDECLVDLPPDGREPAYQVWRARIRDRFAGQQALHSPPPGAEAAVR